MSELLRYLRDGAALSDPAFREQVMGTGSASDVDVAMALVDAFRADENKRVWLRPTDSEPEARVSLVTGSLERLPLSLSTDIDALALVLRVGRIGAQRAAAQRLLVLVKTGQLEGSGAEALARLLAEVDNPDVAWDVSEITRALPGGLGRAARADRERFFVWSTTLREQVRRHWEGELEEPLPQDRGEDWVRLSMRCRDVGVEVVNYLASAIDGSATMSAASSQTILKRLRVAGDPRLVPSLIARASQGFEDDVIDVAEILARIDDPRSQPALVRFYETAATQKSKTIVAGALAFFADLRGLPLLLEGVSSAEPAVRKAALEGLVHAAGREEVPRLLELLSTDQRRERRLVIRTLGRLGDPRALPVIEELLQTETGSVLRETQRSLDLILRQIRVNGEEPPPSQKFTLVRPLPISASASNTEAQFWSRMEFAFGVFLSWFRRFDRAVAWLQQAAKRSPRWCRPWVAMALIHARQGQHPLAIGAFRRAIDLDGVWVQSQRSVMIEIARVFLARGRELAQSDKAELGQALIDEANDLDLSQIPPDLRFELERRRGGRDAS